jgi:chloride channel protein, CIC family
MAHQFIERIRRELGRPDVLAPLAALGVLAGFLAGALVLSFRLAVEWVLAIVVGIDDPENFETLSLVFRAALPFGGAIVIALMFERCRPDSTQVGIPHVMERLAYFKADLPWRNAVLAYVGGLISLASGHSLGREGPAVHLGAAVSSWIGRVLRAPNNSSRTLIACGTAAAIAASFNTPIAGVIFAMEVVLMEYTIAGFTPVIVSSVVAAWMSRAVYGPAAAFDVPALELGSLLELPYLVFVGVAIGAIAAGFTWSIATLKQRSRNQRILTRFTLAGAITAVCAVFVPEVLGVGYDTVEDALTGVLPITVLVTIVLVKWLASATAAGLGLPAGLIAPTLVIGACAGAALGVLGHTLAPELSASPSLYAMLGMGAMMGATLQAPLAALMAILELTANVNIILPGMVCIISATVTCKAVFGAESVFITMLKARGIDYFADPVAQALSRTAVSQRMREDFAIVPRHINAGEAARLCSGTCRWLVIRDGDSGFRALVHAEAVLTLLETTDQATEVDMLGTALPRRSTASISIRATLQEARMALAQGPVQTLCVVREHRGKADELKGVLTESELTT